MRLSAEERARGRLSTENLARALRTLRETGMVVVEDMYERSWVAELRAAFDEELERHIAARGGLEGIKATTFGTNHIGMHLPLTPPFAAPRILANPVAVQVMAAALGNDLRCSFYHSNTAYPGSGTQDVHRDTGPVFGSELQVPTPVVHVVLNLPLCDFTVENGCTEVWPGTHLIVDAVPEDGQAAQLHERVTEMASLRTTIPAGAIAIRDLRLWHRGMPNRSQEIRTMLAIVYQRSWAAPPKLLNIPRRTWDNWPEEARSIFRHNNVMDEARAGASGR
jgi:ectoine hydroxylase-related dioxygenase (phytanoyl-CoA dioxygenase family)